MENEKIENVGGLLRKKKNSGLFRIFGSTNLRWFEFNFRENIFGYKMRETDKKFKKSIPLDQLTNYINHLEQEDKKFCEWRYGFQILLNINKKFILFVETDVEYKKWTDAFDFIFKRIPVSYPLIKNSVLVKELEVFEAPYLENEKKMKIQTDEDETNRLRLVEEDKANILKLEEEEVNPIKPGEEQLIHTLEEENKPKYTDDVQDESISSKINNSFKSDEKKLNKTNKSANSGKRSINISYSSCNYKEDLDDWNYCDDIDERNIELNYYNQIELKSSKEERIPIERNDIRNILNKFTSLHIDHVVAINIESTIKLQDRKEYSLKKDSNLFHISESNIPESSSLSLTTVNSRSDVFSNPKLESINLKGKNHQILNNEYSTEKETNKKPKLFKLKIKNEPSIISSKIVNYFLNFEDTTSNQTHIDPEIDKYIKFPTYNKININRDKGVMHLTHENSKLKSVNNQQQSQFADNYPTKYLNDESKNTYHSQKSNKRKFNNSVVEKEPKDCLNLGQLDHSFNDVIDTNNFSYNYNEISDNEPSFSISSNNSINYSNNVSNYGGALNLIDSENSLDNKIEEEGIKINLSNTNIMKHKVFESSHNYNKNSLSLTKNNEMDISNQINKIQNVSILEQIKKDMERLPGYEIANIHINNNNTIVELKSNSEINDITKSNIFSQVGLDDEYNDILKKEIIAKHKKIINYSRINNIKLTNTGKHKKTMIRRINNTDFFG